MIRLFLLSATIASANCWLGGELLLLRPNSSRPYSTIISPINAIFAPVHGRWVGETSPHFMPGYRINAGYAANGFDARFYWSSWINTYKSGLSANDQQRIWFMYIHPSSSPSFVQPGKLHRTDQYKFQNIDVELGGWNLSHYFRLFGGLRYSRIRYLLSLDIDGFFNGNPALFTVTDYSYLSDTQGTGMRAGLHFETRFFFASASASLLLGSSKGRYAEQRVLSNGSTKFGSDLPLAANHVIGNVEGAFGLNYWWILRPSFIVEIAAGYEINYYSQGMTTEQFFDDADAQGIVKRRFFALDGFTLRLAGHY